MLSDPQQEYYFMKLGFICPNMPGHLNPMSALALAADDSTGFGEIVGDEDAQTAFELLRENNLREEVSDLLEVLDERERKTIFQRFGLDGSKPKTLEEVSQKLGVTRERIPSAPEYRLGEIASGAE
jgi:DNA-directed RNA polymerase specialized sigma subunit